METVIRLKYSELTPSLLEKLQQFFKGQKELEIAVKSVEDFGLTVEESPTMYKKRVSNANENLENNKKRITLTEQEFEQ